MIELSFIKRIKKVSGFADRGEYVVIKETKPDTMQCYQVTLPDGRRTIVCVLKGDEAALEKFLRDHNLTRDALKPI